ncbi:hypothetical protein HY995_03480 [Candidatus Micrarchaeota archaeon]|nr:hypothetical protein [Candidatus Micrarchaeota archaeon]
MARNKSMSGMVGKGSFWPVIGAWAFLIGLVVAVLAGVFAPGSAMVGLVLGVIGVVIGLVNVTEGEAVTFLVAAIAFVVSSSSLVAVITSLTPGVTGAWLAGILSYVNVVVAPAAAVVAIKAIYGVSRSQ